MSSDTLVIRKLVAQCRLGVFDWEQAKPQTVWIDLELAIDAAKAAATDEVRDAVDYARLVSEVKALVEGKPYRLMETLAEEVAEHALTSFAVPRVVVRVTKQALPEIEAATVEVRRNLASIKTVGRSRRSGRFPRAART